MTVSGTHSNAMLKKHSSQSSWLGPLAMIKVFSPLVNLGLAPVRKVLLEHALVAGAADTAKVAEHGRLAAGRQRLSSALL